MFKKFKNIKETDSNWESRHSASYYDELLKHPAPNWERKGIYLITAFFICFLLFLVFGRVDVVVQASGSIRPKGNYHMVEALETGTLTNLYVKSGDFLKKGDPIMELEFSEQQIELSKDTNNLDYEEKKLQRLIRNKKEAEKILKNLAYNLENNSGSLLSGGVLNKFVNLKKAFMDFQNGVGAKFIYDQSLLEFNEEFGNLKDEIQREENVISSLRGDTRLKRERVANAIIRMPFSGIIGELSVNNVGQNIIRGQTVASLMEDGQPLEAIVEVSSKDIGAVRIGLSSVIKVKAFHQNDFGVVEGTVSQIIPNTKEKDSFTVILNLGTQDLNQDGKEFQLFPGLKVVADIVIDRKSIYRILFRYADPRN